MNEDTTSYEPYAPYISQRRDCPEPEQIDHPKDKYMNPTVSSGEYVTGAEVNKVRVQDDLQTNQSEPTNQAVQVVTVDSRVPSRQPNLTASKVETDQALLHPDIEATAGFFQSESAVENA